MGDSITPNTATPDVGVNPTPTPDPNASPDASVAAPVTGFQPNPAAIPAPAGAAVVPSEYTGNAAPQAQPAPERPANAGFKAGFSSAAPQFGPDASGNIVQTNPTPRNFKGILGSVLGGALRGAAFGMAAEKGESGAAAAQRLSEQAKLQAQTEAQRNLENQNTLRRQKLQEALQTAEAVLAQKRLEMDEETHKALMEEHGVSNQILAEHLQDIKEARANAESAWHAEMAAHDHPPLHGNVKNDNDTYIDTEGKLHTKDSDTTGETTPGVAGTSAGSVANLKGSGAKSAIAKLTTHAPNIANGNLMVTQNGELGQNSGFKLYENSKLDDVITKPFYFQTQTTMKHPDGTPVMQDHVIMPDTKTTFRTTREMLNAAEADVKAKTDQMIKQYELQDKALQPAKTAATTQKEIEDANKAKADAENIRQQTKNIGQQGITVPDNFKLPDNSFQMGKDELAANLTSQGIKLPADFDNLYAIGHYEGDDASYPTRTTAKSGQKDRQTALHQARTLVNPNLDETTYPAIKAMVKSFANPTNGSAGGNYIAYGTATRHLQQLYIASKALENGDLDALNGVRAYYHLQTGAGAPVIFNAIRSALVGELGKTFKGGAADIPERADIESNISTSSSPEQQQDFATSEAHLMQSKAQALANQYYQYKGKLPPNGLDPEVIKAYEGLGINPYEGLPQGARISVGGTNNPTPSQPQPQSSAPLGSRAVLGANPTVPNGATGIAKGTDGRWYFHDISGRVLGEAPAQQ